MEVIMKNKIANKDAREYINRCEDFTGNNTFGQREVNQYIVYSYSTHFPMYVYDYSTREWYENSDKYSRTTSKHQSQCRPRFEIKQKFNTEELKQLIGRGGLAEWVKWKAVA